MSIKPVYVDIEIGTHFSLASRPPLGVCRAEGMVKNFNTLEEFKKADKNKMLHNAAKAVGLTVVSLDQLS